jgi:hypothetical protein
MQFTDGGFVAHRVTLEGRQSRFSIWVNPLGILSDAERIVAADRPGTNTFNQLLNGQLDCAINGYQQKESLND